MLELNKRQWFVLVLISLFIYGLTWGALLPSPASNQVKAFGSDYPHEMPLGDDESHSASLPLWQAYQASIALVQGFTPSKNPLNTKIRAATYDCHHSVECGHASTMSLFVDSFPNTVFKFVGAEAFHQLDIPPPHTLAAL